MIEITFNRNITPEDCCGQLAHFQADKQKWQFSGLPYQYKGDDGQEYRLKSE
jgi:hypothetical protein